MKARRTHHERLKPHQDVDRRARGLPRVPLRVAGLAAAFLLLATPRLPAQEPPPQVKVRVVDEAVPGGVARMVAGIDVVAVNVIPTSYLKNQPVIAGQATKLECLVYEYHPEGTNPDPVPWKGRIEAGGKVLVTFSSQAAHLEEHAFDGDATMTSWSYHYDADWTPASSGWNETRCVVDTDKAVVESNEANNVKNSKAWVDGPKTASLSDQPAPIVKAIPGGPLQLAEAELVTTSAALQPPLPTEGQKIKVLATVQNKGGMPSQNGLGFLLFCDQLPGQPKCPGTGPFSTTLPSIPAGQTHQAAVSPDITWPAGKYRLVVGTDVIFANDFVELELVVKPTKFGGAFDPSGSYGGVPLREGEVQEQDDLGDPGEERGLNPQPEPPSAEARPGLVPRARVRTAAAKAFMAPLWNGKRVDLCLVWGGQCGEPAATEFCERSGYAQATDWKPANDIGAQTPTVVLSSGQVCSDASCDGFTSITCSK
ncbi:MAG: hypothetical protein ACREK5_07065 [Gemmatimonadota bacterium]